MNWFTEVEGNILNRFDLYLDGDYRPCIVDTRKEVIKDFEEA